MTTTELSAEFDILYNNITSNQAPGLSEYEKSVFLTQAQEAIVTELYNGNLKDSFESSEAYTRYLSSLVTEKIKTPESNKVLLDDNVLFIVYEKAIIDDNKTAVVVPTSHDVLSRVLENPFKGPNDRRVLRVSLDNIIELYSGDNTVTSYTYRYIRKPRPIILSGLDIDTIDGQDMESTTLDVPEVLHRTILLRAVQLAKTVWQS